jgi:hypothetical protein
MHKDCVSPVPGVSWMYPLPGGVFGANIHDQTVPRGREDIVIPSILATNQLGYNECARQITTAGTGSTQGRTDTWTDRQTSRRTGDAPRFGHVLRMLHLPVSGHMIRLLRPCRLVMLVPPEPDKRVLGPRSNMVRGDTTIHLDPAVLEEVSPLVGREMLVGDGHLQFLLASLGAGIGRVGYIVLMSAQPGRR